MKRILFFAVLLTLTSTAVFANSPRDPAGMVWVYINDPGVSGHERFDGYMSKYETTNAQYCQFLNAAKASNLITVYTDNVVYATNDTSHSQPYYNLAGEGLTYNLATNGGASRIHYSSDVFRVDPGLENHPVTYVSWYGAAAFCNYYGYRLPTEWEWQAVADYDGSYTYGCGMNIDNNMVNYLGSTHPYGTTTVGTFGTYGYRICDMAGNVQEWTSLISGRYCVIRGGGWEGSSSYSTVSSLNSVYPYSSNYGIGFRVCRVDGPAGMVWVYINDTGVSGHERFDGYISKYETTNAQYCQFLNAAKVSKLIKVHNNGVYATSDTSHSQLYYNLAGAGLTGYGPTNGGAARIHYTGSSFTVDSGVENHPVTYVSWYGATAFCNYYGYRLPTEWEWQAVADYNDNRPYPCGASIDSSQANIYGSTHPYGTTAVGAFETYGYGMCDMAGNVFEWTSSVDSGGHHLIRGGGWDRNIADCTVSYRDYDTHDGCPFVGFRVCR